MQMIGIKNLYDIKQLTKQNILDIFAKADEYNINRHSNILNNKIVANLFFENSTRTLASFEIAAKNLGANVITLNIATSSVNKGETLQDTVDNIAAMGVDYIIIRHGVAGAIADIAKQNNNYSIISGGDCANQHPSQALLDAYTMQKHFGSLQGLNVVICGDILHSRVAKSNIDLLKNFGVNLTLVAPEVLLPPVQAREDIIKYTTHLDDALFGADVVMCLRVQKERFSDDFTLSIEDYKAKFCLNKARANIISANSIIMHPGPVNRGVEIDSDVIEDKKSKIIEQVSNGVLIRQAILSLVG
jgi:aspartate carbamoyltransferase catalytic subunit